MKSSLLKHAAFLVILSATNQGYADTKYDYDNLNRLKKVTYADGFSIQYTYDANGNRLSRTVTSPYRLISVDVPSGGGSVSGSGIKAVGEVVTLQPIPGHHWKFDRLDENGIPVSNTSPYTFVVEDSRTFSAYFSELDAFTAFVSDYGLNPTGNGSLSADPDSDGQNNLMEFALGSNPTTPNARTYTEKIVLVGGQKHLSLTYVRRKGLGPVTLQPRLVTSPKNGIALTSTEVSSTDNGDGTETVEVRSTVPLSQQPSQFFTLAITHP